MVSGECVLYIILYQVGCWVPAVDYKSDPYVPATVQVQVLIPGNYIYTCSRHPAKKEKEKKEIASSPLGINTTVRYGTVFTLIILISSSFYFRRSP